MEGIKISLDAAGRNGEVNVVRVDGVIDTMTATELESVLDSLLKQERFNIIIDLAGVDYISSAGWGIFISNIREIRAHSGDIKLARMIPSVHEIFELLEFDSILQSYDNIDKARNSFQGNAAESIETSPAPATARVLQEETAGEVKTEEFRPLTPTSSPATTTADPAPATVQPQSLTEQVLGLVRTDPFYTIREIARLVNEAQTPKDRPVGWWKVWNILRRHSLLSKRKRFRFSRR
jgi:anti-sigma B factor antagonist